MSLSLLHCVHHFDVMKHALWRVMIGLKGYYPCLSAVSETGYQGKQYWGWERKEITEGKQYPVTEE